MAKRTKSLAGGAMAGITQVKGGALENLLRGLAVDRDSGVQDALVVYSADDRVARAIQLIRTGEMRSMAAAFTTQGIGMVEFTQILGKVQTAHALGRAVRAALTTNEDMAQDARSRHLLCQRCDGLKKVHCEEGDEGAFVDRMAQVDVRDEKGRPTGETVEQAIWRRVCPSCDGSGKLREPGDKASRQMILEQAGLLKRGPAVQVNVQNYAGLGLAESPASAITLDVEEG